jgi:hypothetical protein
MIQLKLFKLVAVGRLLATNEQQPVLLHICNLLTGLICLQNGPVPRTKAVSVIPTTQLQQKNYHFSSLTFSLQLLATVINSDITSEKQPEWRRTAQPVGQYHAI